MGAFRASVVSLAAAAAFFGGHASAGADPIDMSWYATVGYGQQSGGQLNLASAIGRIGLRFFQYFGVEGEFDLGVDHHQFVYYPECLDTCPDYILLGHARLANSEGLYGVGYLPLTDYLDLFARLGYRFSNYSADSIPGFNEQAFEYGAGAEAFIDGKNGLRADFSRQAVTNKSYTSALIAGSTVNVWSVSFVHRF